MGAVVTLTNDEYDQLFKTVTRIKNEMEAEYAEEAEARAGASREMEPPDKYLLLWRSIHQALDEAERRNN